VTHTKVSLFAFFSCRHLFFPVGICSAAFRLVASFSFHMCRAVLRLIICSLGYLIFFFVVFLFLFLFFSFVSVFLPAKTQRFAQKFRKMKVIGKQQ
jgi:hypothetical protein